MLRELAIDLKNLFSFSSNYSLFHSIDPRIKMLYEVLTIVSVVLTKSVFCITILILVNLVLVIIGRIPLNRLLSTFRAILIFFIVMLTLNIVIEAILSLYSLSVFNIVEILQYAGITVLKLTIVTLSIMVFTNTTTPRDIVQSLSSLGLRSRYLDIIVLIFRFIPLVFDEVLDIIDAQRSRGIEWEKSSLKERLRGMKSIIVPAFVCSLLRARDLYEALELRGFGYSKKRTFYRQLHIAGRDLVFISAIIAIYTICILI